MGSYLSSGSSSSNHSTRSNTSEIYDDNNQRFYVDESRKRDHILADNMKKQDTEVRQFASNLIVKGHTCIEYAEVYPVKLSWCEQEICIKE